MKNKADNRNEYLIMLFYEALNCVGNYTSLSNRTKWPEKCMGYYTRARFVRYTLKYEGVDNDNIGNRVSNPGADQRKTREKMARLASFFWLRERLVVVVCSRTMTQ